MFFGVLWIHFWSHLLLTFQILVWDQRVSLSGAHSAFSPIVGSLSASDAGFPLGVCPSSCHLRSCASWAPQGVFPFWLLPCVSSLVLPTTLLSLVLAWISRSAGLADASVSCYPSAVEYPPRRLVFLNASLFWFLGDVSHFGAPPDAFYHLCVLHYVFLFWFCRGVSCRDLSRVWVWHQVFCDWQKQRKYHLYLCSLRACKH